MEKNKKTAASKKTNSKKSTSIKKAAVKTTAASAKKSTSKKVSNTIDIKIKTSSGDIEIELYPDKAPVTVENFVSYIEDKFFDNLIFHRVIPNFMIQGGGLYEDLREKSTKAPIIIESDNGLKNERGTIAMARTMDPHSATSQFFINLVDNDFLNFRSKDTSGYGYAVFGKVTKGMDVVDKIGKVKTSSQGYHDDVPVTPVVIKSISAKNTDALKKSKAKKTDNKKTEKKSSNTVNILMKTNIGDIKLELYPDKAPVTVENFLSYVKDNFYDKLIFHRVIENFMIQGGGFDEKLQQKPTKAPIVIESDNGLKNERGTIAMARTRDPNSATCQFFINHIDNNALNFRSKDISGYGYAVFGKVTEGMDIVDRIATVPTGTVGFMQDVPQYLIQIETIKII